MTQVLTDTIEQANKKILGPTELPLPSEKDLDFANAGTNLTSESESNAEEPVGSSTETDFRVPTKSALVTRRRKLPSKSPEVLAAGRRKSTTPAPVCSGLRARSRSRSPRALLDRPPITSKNKYSVSADEHAEDFKKLAEATGKLPDPNMNFEDSLEEDNGFD